MCLKQPRIVAAIDFHRDPDISFTGLRISVNISCPDVAMCRGERKGEDPPFKIMKIHRDRLLSTR